MISRPSTDQVILDCCTELLDGVLPHVTDEVIAARVKMIDGVLRAAAARAAHEIAWMEEESAAMLDFVAAVGSAQVGSAQVGSAVPASPAAGAATPGSMHLADVTERYCRAAEVFSDALEGVRDTDADLWERGVRILDQRIEHERLARGVWSSAAGR